jgi:hypothetical protein
VAGQVANGKGFEWAVAAKLSSELQIPVVKSAATMTAEASFKSLSPNKKALFEEHASRAVTYLLALERKALQKGSPEQVWLATDAKGKKADVRDVLVGVQGVGRARDKVLFGISCKTNHSAYKHSRLSESLDWVSEWHLSIAGASEAYWNAVGPVFEKLSSLRSQALAPTWDEAFPLDSKVKSVYQPVLGAWVDEVQRLMKDKHIGASIPALLFQAMLGAHSYYKVISREKLDTVALQAYNFGNDLSTRKTLIPTKILSISRHVPEGQSEDLWNSVNVFFDRGFTLNFRIHNGSSKVEPSLKFDVSGISVPPEDLFQTVLL